MFNPIRVLAAIAACAAIYAGFSTAHASRLESGAGSKFYLNAAGKQINALEADKATTMDEKVFQCQPVEKVCNEKTQKCTIKNQK